MSEGQTTSVPTVYAGEVQLMNWGESSNSGAWVKFWIPSEELERFRHLKTKSGKIAGHRMMAVMVEVGDGEQPVDRSGQQAADEGASVELRGGPLARDAAMLCNNPEFQRYAWVFSTPELRAEGHGTPCAAAYMRSVCGIESRRELDHDATARAKFGRMAGDFRAWRDSRGRA